MQSETPRRGYLRPVFARKGVVLLAMVLVPLTALVASLSQPVAYEASARVFLSQGSVPGEAGSPLGGNFDTPQRAVKTQARLAHSPVVAAAVLDEVPAKNGSAQRLLRESTVEAETGGDILAFSVRDGDPDLAQRLATEYARQFTIYRREIERIPIEEALDQLRSLPEADPRSELAESLRELEALRPVTGSAAAVVDRAESATKTRPKTLQNVVAGLLLGTAFGLGLAFLWDALDSRVRTSAEIAQALGLSELATIGSADPDDAEAFRYLRAGVLTRGLERGVRTLLVTSAFPGEGKTTVALNLARALVRTGRDVTVVDLNLRGASVDLESEPGLTDVAVGSVALHDALAPITVEDAAPGAAAGTLRVLPSGPPPPDPDEFLATAAFDRILGDVADSADVVIVDAPPLLGVGDAVTLSAKADAILLVARAGEITRPALADLRRVLAGCPAETLGFVLTGARSERQSAAAPPRSLRLLEGRAS